ncbi:MAG: hypothetical protein A2148_06380 [Chloroflexi bacterium RBG_16_68_14]|nr:MAG: hypothetical protein A2148_06380 [Chloroflexi bacterium RBG_16_68_14]
MTGQTPAVLLAAHQVKAAAEVLGRAFLDDPLAVWIVPNEARRARVLPWFFRIAVRYGQRHGQAHTMSGSMQGVAVWHPPERALASTVGTLGAEAATLLFRLRLGELRRALTATGHLERLHKRDAPPRHWYLAVLGVDPPYQGQGVGSALLEPILSRMDGEGLPCYTETARERNVSFYRKHGFQVIEEGNLPKGGPRYWTLLREPRR